MRATKVYAETTARGISVKTLEWISELVDRFGDDEVAEAITAEAPRGEMKGLIGRVRDRLAKEAIHSMRRPTPPALTREQLMAWIWFDEAPAAFPVTWDAGRIGLSHEDYIELVAWSARGRRRAQVEVPA